MTNVIHYAVAVATGALWMISSAAQEEAANGLAVALINLSGEANSDTRIRHYQVRAICYHRETKEEESLPELYLTKEFSEFFEVKAEIAPAVKSAG